MRCPGCGKFRAAADMEVVDEGAPVCASCRRAAIPRDYPYTAGGFVVLGPDVVMYPDASRIRFRGEWYHPVNSHAPKGRPARVILSDELMAEPTLDLDV